VVADSGNSDLLLSRHATATLSGIHRQQKKYVGVVRVSIVWLIGCRKGLQITADFFAPPINCNPLESALWRPRLGGPIDE